MTYPTATEFNNGAFHQFTNDGVSVNMHREGGVYHVCVYIEGALGWNKTKVFHTLGEAKKQFSRYARIAKL